MVSYNDFLIINDVAQPSYNSQPELHEDQKVITIGV